VFGCRRTYRTFFIIPNYSSTRPLVHSFVVSRAAHAKAEKKLEEERPMPTRIDNELKELERMIKEKKQVVSDADLQLKKYKYSMQVLTKEKTATVNFVRTSSSSMIPNESEYVLLS
jgi:hypothetical protein